MNNDPISSPPSAGAEVQETSSSSGTPGVARNIAAAPPLFPSIAAGMASGGDGLRLYENDQFLSASFDLPGVRAKDLQVFVRHVGVLYVEGVRVFFHDDEDLYPNVIVKRYLFSQAFIVNTDEVNLKQAKANLSNGVLVVKAPKYRHYKIRDDESNTTFEIPMYEDGVPLARNNIAEASSSTEEESLSEDEDTGSTDTTSAESETSSYSSTASTDSSDPNDAASDDIPKSNE